MALVNVILLSAVPGLGNIGSQVRVRRGYFRNFLYPKGKALFLNKENQEYFEKKKAHFKKLYEADREEALLLKETLAKIDVLVCLREVKESGELYGTLTPKEVVAALEAAQMPKLDIHQVHFVHAITVAGVHRVRLTLHSDVEIEVPCVVAATDEDAQAFLAKPESSLESLTESTAD